MDLDPSVEPGLDSLSLTLPLPYRVGLIIVLGMWGAHEEIKEYILTSLQLFGRGAQICITLRFSKL